MKASLPQLKSLLSSSVLELRFTRRRPKAGQALDRRMLCTNAHSLLDSLAGQAVFGFTQPTQAPKYNPASYNLIFTYDLFMQSFRAVNSESVDVLSVIPITTEDEMAEFWEYFNQSLAPMSAEQKQQFMRS